MEQNQNFLPYPESVMDSSNMTPIEVALKMDEQGRVSAKNLYEFLQLNKGNYARWARTNIDENPFAEKNKDFFPFFIHEEWGGQGTCDYTLTADFAKKLAMQSGSKRGEVARSYFIACEQGLARMEKERRKWEVERIKSTMKRHILTDTIQIKVAESPNKRFAYPNYTKLIYRVIFGMTMDELRERFCVKGKESIRDSLTVDQLREVEDVEMIISGLISLGMGYSEIKNCLQDRYIAQITA